MEMTTVGTVATNINNNNNGQLIMQSHQQQQSQITLKAINNSINMNQINIHKFNSSTEISLEEYNHDVKSSDKSESGTVESEVKETLEQLTINVDRDATNILTPPMEVVNNVDRVESDQLPDKPKNSEYQEQKTQSQSPDSNSKDLIIDSSVQLKEDTELLIQHDSFNSTVDDKDAVLADNDLQEEKEKDMVTLKNLEISPPPPPPSSLPNEDNVTIMKVEEVEKTTRRTSGKRKKSITDSSEELNESTDSTGRSKRKRMQTKLFQAGPIENRLEFEDLESPKRQTSTKTKSARSSARKSSVSEPISSTTDLQDVIFYEKNDYLAIRNEENSFYLCQLAENVRINRRIIKVKWLDTDNDGKSYFLTSQYDSIPQQSIIMPVQLSKSKHTKNFTLSSQDKDNIMDRLKRSLNVPLETTSSQESTETL